MGIGIVLLLVIGAVIVWFIHTYNRFVHRQMEIDNGWSAIDIQLKRRHDLIPNLVETARGYMKHESGTLTRIAELRASIAKAPAGANVLGMESELTKMIGSLLAVVENYPELKANQNFMSLQEELASTENRIAFARQYYNEVVKQFNISIRVFPASVVAGLLHLQSREMWDLDASPAERGSVAVTFD